MSPRLSPEFDFDALREQANRERAEAMRLAIHERVVLPLLRLFSHAPRPHRHHQRTHRRAAA